MANRDSAVDLSLDEFVKYYEFKDCEEVYTNGAMLIPSFRIQQWIDANFTQEKCEEVTDVKDISWDFSKSEVIGKVESEVKPDGLHISGEKVNTLNRPTKTTYYLDIAKDVCKRSTCIRRHYGAVIVNEDEIVSTGYNGAPRGILNCSDVNDCPREDEGHEHNDGDYRSCPAVHAEANAIISASRREMIGATLYLYGEDRYGNPIDALPCPVCMGLIRNAGISKVITIGGVIHV